MTKKDNRIKLQLRARTREPRPFPIPSSKQETYDNTKPKLDKPQIWVQSAPLRDDCIYVEAQTWGITQSQLLALRVLNKEGHKELKLPSNIQVVNGKKVITPALQYIAAAKGLLHAHGRQEDIQGLFREERRAARPVGSFTEHRVSIAMVRPANRSLEQRRNRYAHLRRTRPDRAAGLSYDGG